MKMKENVHILLMVLAMATAFLTGSCSGRINMIPEVSNALYDDVLGATFKGANFAWTIIARDSNLVFFTLEGKIYRFNLEKKLLDFLVDLTTPIEPEIFHQKDTVVLKEKNSTNFIFFDLREMKVMEMPEKINAEKIISMDAEHKIIGYLTAGRLVFTKYSTGEILAELNIETAADSGSGSGSESESESKSKKENDGGIVFYNSADILIDDTPKTLILTSRDLYIFDKRRSAIETVKLESKAASGFLPDGGFIYYGSQQRELVKFSVAAGKVQWRFKLADQLKIEPRNAGPYIVITPEDHNIYFFNKRGTLYWWEKLDSTRLLSPVVMKENVAVFLWNKTVKFLNYKNKSSFSYPLDKPVFSNALHIGEYLYVIADTGDDERGQPLRALTKIGNNFGVAINTDPQSIIPMGRSIKFNLERFNLVKPELKINILDAGNESVFEKTISYKDDPSFVWIPNRAMTYRLVLAVNAENKKGIMIEYPFDVIDVEKLLSQYYYQLQKNSSEDQVIHYPGHRQDLFYPTEPAKKKKNEKTTAVPAKKKN